MCTKVINQSQGQMFECDIMLCQLVAKVMGGLVINRSRCGRGHHDGLEIKEVAKG